jgi:alpha-tubulin suppressor-like RCC1 family protein
MRVLRALILFGATLVTTGCPAIIGLDKDYQLADGDIDSGVMMTDAPADVPPENACGMNRLICNGNCIDVSADPLNCGLCDKKCGMGFVCMNSQCTDDIVQVAAGGDHACVVLRGGKVYCWGSNAHAEVGAPTAGDMMCGATRCRPAPTDTGLTDVAEVVLGTFSGCARKNDATVWCWGTNQHLELGHSGGDALCNAVACNSVPKQVMGVTAQKIGAGSFHYCALTMTGAVYCWGNNSEGELGRGGGAGANSAVASIVPALSGNVVSISSGLGQHSCAVKGDGTVWCWGYNLRGALGHTVGTNADALDASMVNYCNGTPKQVVNDVMNMPFTGIDAVTIADRVSCGHKMGGGWWCWGNQGHGALGTGGAFDASNHAAPIAISVVPGGVVKLATGAETPCGTDTASKLFCWGRNDWGAIGDGTFTGSACEGNTPCHTDAIAAVGLTGIELVDTGGSFAIAKKTDGTLWTWGANLDARLGHTPNTAGDKAMCATGTTICNPTPSQVMGLP